MKPTRQDIIEDLQNRIQHNRVATIDDLKLEISCAEYDGDNPIDEYEDVLTPMEWSVCDKCGELWESEHLYWEYCSWGEESEELQRGIKLDGGVYTTLCENCVRELCKMGEKGD